MTKKNHNCLILISTDLVGGVERSRECLSPLLEHGSLVSISSVYKRFTTEEKQDINSRICFVIRMETQSLVDDILEVCLSLCQEGRPGINRRGFVECILLAYDEVVLMSPRLTLPYPTLHQDSLVVRAAAEAWGQYAHPIYEKNLSEISRIAAPALDAEFYMQGKTLVDF